MSSEVGFFSLSSVNSISKMGKMCLIRSLTVSLVCLDKDYQVHMTNREPGSDQRWTLEHALLEPQGQSASAMNLVGVKEGKGNYYDFI